MATIRETILSYPSLDDCENYLDNVVMVKRRIYGMDECTTDNIAQATLCAADLYAMVVNSTDFTEGKLSITHPRSWYIQTAKRLYIEAGEPRSAAMVGNKVNIKGKAGNRW